MTVLICCRNQKLINFGRICLYSFVHALPIPYMYVQSATLNLLYTELLLHSMIHYY